VKDILAIREDKYEVLESYKGPVQDYTGTPRALLELEHLLPTRAILLLHLGIGVELFLGGVVGVRGRPPFIGGEEEVYP
jgi:hypothetical protein